MQFDRDDLAKYADAKAEELCNDIANKTSGIYDAVVFIDEAHPPPSLRTSLFMHRSSPTTFDDAVAFSLYFVDKGDLAYEPRLQHVEKVLSALPEIMKLTRVTAPDSMLKDMVVATVVLRDRRRGGRSAPVDSRHAH